MRKIIAAAGIGTALTVGALAVPAATALAHPGPGHCGGYTCPAPSPSRSHHPHPSASASRPASPSPSRSHGGYGPPPSSAAPSTPPTHTATAGAHTSVPPVRGSLPVTGPGVAYTVIGGAVLLSVGAWLVVAGRRRRTT